ncbi:MAG: hypothetical protein U0491_01835 [Candidatus Saccharimonadales bacterium]
MTKKRWVIIGIGAVLVSALVAALIIMFHAPSKSVVKQPTQQSETVKNPDPIPITTAYFSTTLPPGFAIKSQEENPNSQDLLQLVATKTHSNGQQIAINVATMGPDGINGVASYNLRAKNPAQYTPVEFGGMPIGVESFYSQTASVYEITGFWPKGNLYASISVSGAPGDRDTINKLYSQVLDGWRWR